MIYTAQDLVEYFRSKLDVKNLDQIKNLLENSNPHSSDDIKDFLLWANNTYNLKVVSQNVPSNILQEAKLHDIKVECRGPDDKVYDSSDQIRAKIARGNSILELNENGSKKFRLVVYALRKFTGGLGDEDDIDRKCGEWKKYFLKDFENVNRIVSLQKANGEAAHLSCVWANGNYLLCAGSKNVHLIFKTKNDLLNYSEQRYSYAKIIGLAVLRHLEKMDTKLKDLFLTFLCIFNLTVVFEILNPETQHVEDLSYLSEPLLKFITFTRNVIETKPQSLCSMTPDCAIQIASLFELSCVKMELVNKSDIEEHLTKVRKDYGYEGVVLYFMDSESNVVGLLKKKTTWYIILRAVREKLRNYLSPRNSDSISDLEKKIKKRLVEIKAWIGFNDDDLDKWTNLCCEFVLWFDKKYHENLITKEEYGSKFPVLWNKFLAELSLSDKIEININRQNLESSNIEQISQDLTKLSV